MHLMNRWWLIRVLALLLVISGCEAGGHSSRLTLADNGRFMEMWNTYIHCFRSENLDAMRVDAKRLSHAAGAIDSPADPISPARDESPRVGLSPRLSVDPAAMAAACALHVGQVAQGTGHPFLAKEMFQMVITHFQHPSYRYYVAQARQGLEALHAATPAVFSTHTM
jgi:hypothetical protein